MFGIRCRSRISKETTQWVLALVDGAAEEAAEGESSPEQPVRGQTALAAEPLGVKEEGEGAGDRDAPTTMRAKLRKRPAKPNPEEITRHNLTHTPYADLCEVCVQGRARQNQHRRLDENRVAQRIPLVMIDYTFPYGEDGATSTQLLRHIYWILLSNPSFRPRRQQVRRNMGDKTTRRNWAFRGATAARR